MRQAAKAPARILLNTQATKELLDAEGYEALIIAVGSSPMVPKVPGIDRAHLHWAPDADAGRVEVGRKTVIVGAGSVGVESAIGLRQAGKDMTIVEMAPDMRCLNASAGGMAMELMTMVEQLQIPIHLNCRLEEVTDAAEVGNIAGAVRSAFKAAAYIQGTEATRQPGRCREAGRAWALACAAVRPGAPPLGASCRSRNQSSAPDRSGAASGRLGRANVGAVIAL